MPGSEIAKPFNIRLLRSVNLVARTVATEILTGTLVEHQVTIC
jgi:hypothetical protein